MNICIDIGNTLSKIEIFDGDVSVYSSVICDINFAEVNAVLSKFPADSGIVSSVRQDDIPLYNDLAKVLRKFIVLSAQTPVPVSNHYKTPETLGKDRLAAVIGANFLYPGKNILVIDAGSAITFDFINEKGEYHGGTISPGLTMRFKALNQFTSRLPLLSPQENIPLLGGNTAEAIMAGVQNGIVFETDAYILELNKVYSGLVTLITGGDAKFFDNKLKNTIFVIPNLVLIGLNRILNFNA